jgi:succinate dehydrogenase / fumarate reductase iron-sulfur subunit
MAEFTLPANSKIRKDGRVFKAPAGAKNVRVFKI